jgi:hypothetical protein
MSQEQQEINEYAKTADRAFAGEKPEQDLSGLGSMFLAEFAKAEQDRLTTEERWLQDLRQYKGKYDPEEEAAIGASRSKSYVRKTRVKVKTVDSRVADLLFPAGSDKNWDIAPTPIPTVDESERQAIIAQMKQAMAQQMQAQAQQQAQAQPGQPVQAIQPGQIPEPPKEVVDAAILAAVTRRAKGMAKQIDDQLIESRYKKCALQVLHSGHLYGTGVLKGPLVERRVRTRFVPQGGNWVAQNESYLVPFVDVVPLWRFYPDMGATEIGQCRFAYERHTFTHAQIYALTTNKSFRKEEIVRHLEANPDGLLTHRYYDSELKAIGDRQTKQGDIGGQFEVLERWGWIDAKTLAGIGVVVAPERAQETFFSNIWVLPNGVVIKAALQPLNGVTWPYHLYYFDKDETSIFGEGLSSIMRDDQKMLNAATRMSLDNAAITSGPVIEMDISQMASAVNPADVISPWNVVMTNGKHPGQPAIRPVVIPNNLEWLQAMARQFDQNADEVTAIPRYMSGDNATNGAAGTSSGLSMLMGAVNIVIKDLITGYDENITTPFLQSLYRWNMQFNKDASIKGDFDVYARGTASLVAKEVRARQLNEFAQMSANDLDAPFIKRHRLNQLRAEALEMTDVIKTEDEVAAEMQNGEMQQQKEMAQQMQAAQLAEQQAKAAKLMMDAEIGKAKVQQLLASLEQMAADVIKTKAETERTLAEAVSKKVEAVFAALQAGGVATSRPTIAPAGDEILKSSGWTDATPNPGIDMLNGPPVQGEQGTDSLMNKGQTFVQEPRGAQQAPDGQPLPMDGADGGDVQPDLATPTPAMRPNAADVPPQTGMVGRRAGMNTAEIEGAGL